MIGFFLIKFYAFIWCSVPQLLFPRFMTDLIEFQQIFTTICSGQYSIGKRMHFLLNVWFCQVFCDCFLLQISDGGIVWGVDYILMRLRPDISRKILKSFLPTQMLWPIFLFQFSSDSRKLIKMQWKLSQSRKPFKNTDIADVILC